MEKPFVWFDFGGVLSPPLQVLFDGYRDKTGITREQLESAMRAVAVELGIPTLAPIELAVLTEREWGGRLRAHLSSAYPGIDLSQARLEDFGAQWFSDVEPNHVTVNTLRHFREHGFRVGVLTNNVIEWEPHWMRIVSGIGEVEAIVDSCKVGARKPQPEIFRIAEKEADVPPGASILVDDVAENCTAAREFGWKTVHFRDNVQSCRELHSLTGLPGIL